jgi:murein DD-endopeptidase MepM/ murein hydrolase activator NlpD
MKRLGIVELVMSVMCLWAAWFHTPAGALLRTVGAWFFRAHSTARPLLAYYGAGVYAPHGVAPPPLTAPVPPAQVLGYGAWAVLGEEQRGRKPAQVAAQLHELSARLGSDDAAVLALFCGEEAARYAVSRVEDGNLEELARQLPPRYADRVALASQAMMLAGAYALSWPLPESALITSPFGVRDHPMLGEPKQHSGIDLGVPVGTVVRATGAGVVRRASFDELNGRVVLIDHGRGVATVYCHNDELLVRDGQPVEKGQAIARSGNSGRSTGPHLHYQLDLAGQAVDPLRYRSGRPKRGPSLATD